MVQSTIIFDLPTPYKGTFVILYFCAIVKTRLKASQNRY